MHTPEMLVQDQHRFRLEQAEQSRTGRQIAELRRLQRVRQRAERRLVRAQTRAGQIRESIQMTR